LGVYCYLHREHGVGFMASLVGQLLIFPTEYRHRIAGR